MDHALVNRLCRVIFAVISLGYRPFRRGLARERQPHTLVAYTQDSSCFALRLVPLVPLMAKLVQPMQDTRLRTSAVIAVLSVRCISGPESSCSTPAGGSGTSAISRVSMERRGILPFRRLLKPLGPASMVTGGVVANIKNCEGLIYPVTPQHRNTFSVSSQVGWCFRLETSSVNNYALPVSVRLLTPRD